MERAVQEVGLLTNDGDEITAGYIANCKIYRGVDPVESVRTISVDWVTFARAHLNGIPSAMCSVLVVDDLIKSAWLTDGVPNADIEKSCWNDDVCPEQILKAIAIEWVKVRVFLPVALRNQIDYSVGEAIW
jgi:hypothetical protein